MLSFFVAHSLKPTLFVPHLYEVLSHNVQPKVGPKKVTCGKIIAVFHNKRQQR